VNNGQGPNVETHLMFKATAPCYLYLRNDLNDDNGNGNVYDVTFRWRKLSIDDNGNFGSPVYPVRGSNQDNSWRMASDGGYLPHPIQVYGSGSYNYNGAYGYLRCFAVDAAHPAYVVFEQLPQPGWCKNLRIWAVPI
jgi:hypothetical protein